MASLTALANIMVKRLDTFTVKDEITTCDLLNMVYGSDEVDLSIDDLFELDQLFRVKALENGYVLDSMKNDEKYGLPFDTGFVVRRLPGYGA